MLLTIISGVKSVSKYGIQFYTNISKSKIHNNMFKSTHGSCLSILILGRNIQKRYTRRGFPKVMSTFTCKPFSTYVSEINRCNALDNISYICKGQVSNYRYTTTCYSPGSRVKNMRWSWSWSWSVPRRSKDKVMVDCQETNERSTIYCCDLLCYK